MRPPVEGTIARDRYEDDPETATGLLADKSGYVMTIPAAMVQRAATEKGWGPEKAGGMEKLLARGQERFGIYCAPCHGATGDGKGMIVCKRDKPTQACESRGFPPLPTYADPRLRAMPDGQLFATISHGVRTMPAYGPQIPIARSLGHRRLRARSGAEPDGRGHPHATGAQEVSTTDKESTAKSAGDYRIPAKSGWAGSWKIAAGVGAVGIAGAAYGYFGHVVPPERFAYSALFGLFVPLSLALGSLFFVMVLYVTKASWGVTVRRIAELFMRPMPIFAILVIPLVLLVPHIFPWLGAGHEAEMSKETATATAGEHAPGAATAKPPSPIEEARGEPAREPAAMRDLPLQSPKRMEKAEEGAEQEIVEHKRFYLNKQFFLGRLIAYLLIWSWLAQRYFRWSTEQDKTKALENTVAAQSFAPLG